MNKIIIAAIAFAMSATASPALAQKSKKKTARKAVAAKPKIDPAVAALREKMMDAVQKVVVFDSVVVDKSNFLAAYSLDGDIGTVADYDAFFSSAGHPGSYVCVNGMKNRCYSAIADTDGNTTLARSDYYDNQWSAALPISGIDTKTAFPQANYPYMMTDGQTLYFAAKGSESLGGYDIFVTRHDADSKSFLQPENIGMPFNSQANDYMLVIDDINGIGWFASDRNQPEGKVCVYMFVPSSTRENYDTSEMDDNKLEAIADLKSIADTWATDPQARQDALSRYAALRERLAQASRGSSHDGEMFLVINDGKVYTNTRQFVVKANIERYYKLAAMRAKQAKLAENIDNLRHSFAIAPSRDTQTAIISAERVSDQLAKDIAAQEKQIVNSENKALKNK